MAGRKPVHRSAKAAAIEVLRRARGPLPAAEILRGVMATKGVRLAGKTPAATIAALLSVESRKPDGVFVRVARGRYALRERS